MLMVLLLAAVMIQGLAFGVSAAGPTGTWITGIQVQNESDTNSANITIIFYWTSNAALVPSPYVPGAIADTYNDPTPIPPKGSRGYNVPTAFPNLPSGFVGSAVVSSDQVVAAILQTANTGAGTAGDPIRVGAASGVLEPSTTIYCPYLRRNAYNYGSYIAIQNTSGDTDSANAYVTFKNPDGSVAATATYAIAKFATYIVYMEQVAGLSDGFKGAAVITSTAPLAVVVNAYNQGGGSNASLTSGFESYNGFGAGATKVFLPKLDKRYAGGYQSGVNIQNVGTAATTMTIVFTIGGTSYTKVSTPIQPGSAWAIYLDAEAQSGIPAAVSGTGSAVVTADQPIVATSSNANTTKGHDFIYNGINDGAASGTVLFPKYERRAYAGAQWIGGIQVQNLGTAATTFVATFSGSNLASDLVITSPTIQPGAPWALNAGSIAGLPDGFAGAVVIVSSNGGAVSGVYTGRNDVKLGDSVNCYNGIKK